MRRFTVLIVATVLSLTPAALGCSSGESSAKGDGEPGEQSQLVPRPGQVIVSGLADRVVADGAQSGALAPPFTISARERGLANLTIENATVGGRQVAINWNSGTPLSIGGAGGLDLGASTATVDGSGITWNLDGPARVFLPGSYRITGPVGVGPSGLATPRESVDFEAQQRTLLIARGGTIVRLPPRPIVLEGPGKVTLSGRLRVRTPDGEKPAAQAELGQGPFKVTLSPTGSQLRVEAILQGAVTSS